MIKFKIDGIREEVTDLINNIAEQLHLYDPDFPIEDQCGGYHAFKELCLMEEEPCTYGQFVSYTVDKKYYMYNSPPGFYLLSKIHPNLRDITSTAVIGVRRRIKKGKTI